MAYASCNETKEQKIGRLKSGIKECKDEIAVEENAINYQNREIVELQASIIGKMNEVAERTASITKGKTNIRQLYDRAHYLERELNIEEPKEEPLNCDAVK